MKKTSFIISAVFLLILAGCTSNMSDMHNMDDQENMDHSTMDHSKMNHDMGHGDMSSGMSHQSHGEKFSEETAGLPNVEPTKIVNLKDGDTFEMTAEIVQQEVGNRTIKRLAYNRQIPGPILLVVQKARDWKPRRQPG